MASLSEPTSQATSRTATARSKAQRLLSRDRLQWHRQQLQEMACMHRVQANHRRECFALIGEQILTSSRVMRSANFSMASIHDLQYMAELYDQYFLGSNCLALARHFGLHFRWSKRMTSNGGKTVRTVQLDRSTGAKRVHYEIVLSATLLFQTFNDLKRPIRVTGILCSNRLQAMQRIMEHELVHLIELLVWDHSCCVGPRFQGIAERLFGHTEHKHDLITQRERADRQFNVRVGTRVRFRFEGRYYVGTVNRITRRATILVADAHGQLYDDGNRYRKFYVPLTHLAPAAQ
jgi:hypothetical protein